MVEEKLYKFLKQKYVFTCWNCKVDGTAAPSILQESFQVNVGGGYCRECGKQMLLIIDDNNARMICAEHTKKNIDALSGPGLPDACYGPLGITRLKIIRDRTSCGFMTCQKALDLCEDDLEWAVAYAPCIGQAVVRDEAHFIQSLKPDRLKKKVEENEKKQK